MKTDRESSDLRGAVARAVIETREFVDEEGQRIEQPWYGRELAFDHFGNLVEQTFRNADGSSYAHSRRCRNDFASSINFAPEPAS